MEIRVGTSGWSFADWVGVYYPYKLKKSDWIRFYARDFRVAAGTAPILGGYLNDNIAPVATWYGGFVIGVIGIIGFFIISRRQAGMQQSVLAE